MAPSTAATSLWRSATAWDSVLLLSLILFHLFMAPYTKVEESFNIQAMHDLLFHQTNLKKYDHFEFPGVVPRSFLGAMVVSVASSPLVALTQSLGFGKLASLYIVRGVLGCFIWASLVYLRQAIVGSLGPKVAALFCVLCALQFHLPFYASRPLPNIFALICVNLSFSFWLQKRPRLVLASLVSAMVILRCDLLILLGPVGLTLLLTGAISFLDAFLCCALTAILSLGVTVAVDSVLWRALLWPEGSVLFFNTALNKSSEWGVSPFHWYFTSALPRSLLAALPLSLVGVILEPRVRPLVFAVLLFIGLYSFLPHKELRFILPSIPAFNVAAAAGLARLWQNQRKAIWGSALWSSVGLLALSSGAVALFAAASYVNYPGGQAISVLHAKALSVPGSVHIGRVHIGVLPAMTGVSRFTEMDPPWSYSKQEGLHPEQLFDDYNFTYLLSGDPQILNYECLAVAPGFPRIEIQRQKLFPGMPAIPLWPTLELKPAVYILVSNASHMRDFKALWKSLKPQLGPEWQCPQ